MRDAQAQLFERGFVVLPRLLSDDVVRELDFEVSRLSEDQRALCDKEGRTIFLTDVESLSDLVFDLARSEKILGLVSTLMDAPVVPMNVELFVKPAGSPHITPPHQDHAFYRKPPERATITVWVALDRATKESGALEFAAGAWRSCARHKDSKLDYFAFELEKTSSLEFQVAEVERGGCVVHHSFAVHKSGSNSTGRPRRALAFSYRAIA